MVSVLHFTVFIRGFYTVFEFFVLLLSCSSLLFVKLLCTVSVFHFLLLRFVLYRFLLFLFLSVLLLLPFYSCFCYPRFLFFTLLLLPVPSPLFFLSSALLPLYPWLCYACFLFLYLCYCSPFSLLFSFVTLNCFARFCSSTLPARPSVSKGAAAELNLYSILHDFFPSLFNFFLFPSPPPPILCF